MEAPTIDPGPVLESLRQDLGGVEQRINAKEAELTELRAWRTRLQRAITALDLSAPKLGRPATKRPRGTRAGGSLRGHMSQETLDGHLTTMWETWGPTGELFSSADVTLLTGVHKTTANRVLKTLHEQGKVRLDRVGGPRHTTKFYALVQEPAEGGPDEQT